MASDEEIPEIRGKLPKGWKEKIKGLRKTMERYLGPVTPAETKSRQVLREKLFELSLVIYSVRNLEYWNTRLPNLLQEVADLVEVELELVPWCPRELRACANDLRWHGKSQVNLDPLN
jgi:hypothetical protein